jgi:MFS family permease
MTNPQNAQEPGERSLGSVLTRPVIALLLLQLMGGMMLSPQRTFFPVYARELGHPAVLIATWVTVRQLMGLVASLVGGTLSDAWGRKWTFLAGQIGFLLCSTVFLFRQPGWIAVLWTLSGFGSGLHTLGGQSYLVDAAPPGHMGLLSALYNWGYTLGGALSSPAAGYLLDNWDYRLFGTVLSVFALATIAVNLFVLPRTSHRAKREATSWNSLFGYRDIATRPPVVLLTLMRFLPTFAYGMASVLIPLLLHSARATKTTIALYATISQVVSTAAQLVSGRAADRARQKRGHMRGPTLVVFAAFIAGIFGLAALPGRVPGLFVFGTLGIAAAWSLSTLLPLWVARVTPQEERGRVLGWIHLWWNAAMVAGAMTGGALVERWPSLPFLIAGVLNLGTIGLVIAFFRLKETVRQSDLPSS